MAEKPVMTVFYNKRLGIIKSVVDGKQDMSFFGKEEEDYKRIYDFLVIEQNEMVHRNIESLIVKDGKITFSQKALEGLQ